MSELILSGAMARAFPTLAAGLAKAQGIFDSIHSFEDIERTFLKGAGLSPNTYRAYLCAVRQLYEFTKGKHPMQITPGDIEAFYDDLAKRVDRNTAALRIAGLKKFFAGIRTVLPIYTSPFELMPEKLKNKLGLCRVREIKRPWLEEGELHELLAWLALDTTTQGVENHAILYMLSTSGLRANELCQLRWGDLDLCEGTWTTRFTGKGGTDAEQELYAPAVEACRKYFVLLKRRNPEPGDALFWTLPVLPGEQPAPMRYHVLWRRVHLVGERARAAGILKRVIDLTPHSLRRTGACIVDKYLGTKAARNFLRHRPSNTEVYLPGRNERIDLSLCFAATTEPMSGGAA